MRVLIPAMEKRSALVAARSLGKRGIEIIGCSDKRCNPGFFSKYCHKKYLYRSPFSDVRGYLDDIKKIIEKEKPEVFLPINEETLLPLLEHREELEKIIKLPLPPNEILAKASNKILAGEVVKLLNIPCPKEGREFPLVARPIQSRRIEGNEIVADKLFYIRSKKDLSQIDLERYFLQEYLPGQGYGFYALFDRGNPKAYFMMRRIHEVPFTGGPSSLRESIYDENLKEYGLRILEALNWHGVAMVEFRKDKRDGDFKFIEINGRLWGSLALAYYAGVDFPWLLFQLAQGEKIQEKFDYKLGIRCRWLFGDVSYLLSVLFGRKIDWRPSRLKAILEFFNFFQKDLHYDYFTKDDLKPALMNLLFFPIKVFKKLCRLKD